MNRASFIRLSLAGAVAGVLVALALAALVPRTEPSIAAPDRSADPLAPTPAPPGDPRRPALAPPRPEPRGASYVRLRAVGPVRIEARVADPRGGPDWAVRVFLAERRVDGNVIGRPRCAQLGRLHEGRFGWIDATNTFRPVQISLFGAPAYCGSITPDLQREPHIDVRTRITDPTRGAADPIQTFAWGLAGRDGTVTIRVGGQTSTLPQTPNGAFVALVPASAASPEVEVRYPTGRPVTERSLAREWERDLPGVARPLPRGAPHVAYRVPDPHGGLPWGVLAMPGEGGGWCSSWPERVVGDRVGWVDYELGTLDEAGGRANVTCSDPKPTRERPLHLSWGGGGGFAGEPGQDPLPGRTARRTLRGMTTITGTAHPDVRSITVASPRDVRTITPSRRAHAFAVVYDGSLPAGELALTATFSDGSTRRETLPTGFP